MFLFFHFEIHYPLPQLAPAPPSEILEHNDKNIHESQC